MNKFSKELEILIPKLKNIGEEILKIYNTDFNHELKEDNSPLTKADMLSNDILVKFLKNNFPKDGIISEETPNEENVYSKERIWIVDPLDGTKDFIQKTGEFSIMVGLLNKERKPILGIVYAPALNKIYYAQKGEGTFMQIKENEPIKLQVSKIENLNEFKLVRSRNHFSEKDQEICTKLKINNFLKMGSVGIKFGTIAQGNAELCYYTTDRMGIWDDCASHIILKEAGGTVFDIDGNEPEYDLKGRKMIKGFIGTNGTNKEKILKEIKNARK